MRYAFLPFSDQLPVDLVAQGKNYDDNSYEILVRGTIDARGFFRNHPLRGMCLERNGEMVDQLCPDDKWIYYEDWLSNSSPGGKDDPEYIAYINKTRRGGALGPFERGNYSKKITPGDW